jgi:hypothetical protein
MNSLLTDQERKDLKRELIEHLNESASPLFRLAFLVLGFMAVVNPGYVIANMLIETFKRSSPDSLELFKALADTMD